ncbi:MAG: discoidin domain-containing protein [Culturomica sp.]|nr:discoidin domain-containing protein [Culturomica sp.]
MIKNMRFLLWGMLFLGTFFYSCQSDDPMPDPETPPGPVCDTLEYPHKLEVIYFVPSDVTPNPGYEERLTTILRDFQVWVCNWMEHWGYGYRSFGLPLRTDGMVDIITVHGKDPVSGYPYDGDPALDGLQSGPVVKKIQAEVDKHYAANNLKWRNGSARDVSERHVLVIMAVNYKHSSVPFYGTGRWCFALDYPDMTAENESKPGSSNYVGGLLHELGHGLNMWHVGPTYSQKNSSEYGTPLMGLGNMSYAKAPTFLHEVSAATLANCELAATAKGSVYYDYDNTDGNVAQPEVTVENGECTVSGTLTSNKAATGVVVRFTQSTEENFLGLASSGYTSVAFLAKPVNNHYEVTFPVRELTPAGASLRMGISVLLSNGLDRRIVPEGVYKLSGQNGVYTLTTSAISRTGWTVTTSQPILPAFTANPLDVNAPASLVDGNRNTCLTLVKPGMTFGGVTVDANEPVWAVIDMGKPTTFNTVLLDFRLYAPHAAWRAKKVSFLQSDDGQNFTLIKQAALETAVAQQIQNVVPLGASVTCRYLRMTYDEWETASGNDGGAMIFSELQLQNN